MDYKYSKLGTKLRSHADNYFKCSDQPPTTTNQEKVETEIESDKSNSREPPSVEGNITRTEPLDENNLPPILGAVGGKNELPSMQIDTTHSETATKNDFSPSEVADNHTSLNGHDSKSLQKANSQQETSITGKTSELSEKSDNWENKEFINEIDDISEIREMTSTNTKSRSASESSHERSRKVLLEQHKALLDRRNEAGHVNIHLQNTLAEHFRRRRVDVGESTHSNIDSMASSIIDTGIDYSSRYAKHMENLALVRNQFMEQKERLEKEITLLKELSEQKTTEAANKQKGLADFILSQAKDAISSRKGRTLPLEDYKILIETWQRKAAAVAAERLENLKLKRQVEKIKAAFKAYDLSESLHLIDFEQMKIENQTYNEKIEERNEETAKLCCKITNTVQMITHANEKLQACQGENSQLLDQMNLWSEKLNNGRDILSKLKQSRDALRSTLSSLLRASGLLGRQEVLRSYEQSVDDIETKKREIAYMKKQTNQFHTRAKIYGDKITCIKQKLQVSHISVKQ